jgi:hypothetical protein
MTIQGIVITRREPVTKSQMTNIYVSGDDLAEIAILVPNRMLDTPAMWSMIEAVLASRSETRDIVMDGDVR